MKSIEGKIEEVKEVLLRRHAATIDSYIDWEGCAIHHLHSTFTPNDNTGELQVIPRVTRNEKGRVVSLANPRVIPLHAEESLSSPPTIPIQLRFLKSLLVLNLSQSRLQGDIPDELGELISLQNLHLAHNKLTGLIPESFAGLVNLRVLDLGNNRLSGPLDTAFMLHSCVYMYLDNNQFTGEIPASIGNMSQLQRLTLQCNEISGEIPQSMVDMPAIEMLQLSNNRLTGLTPSFTLPSSLRWVYLTHNDMQKGTTDTCT